MMLAGFVSLPLFGEGVAEEACSAIYAGPVAG